MRKTITGCYIGSRCENCGTRMVPETEDALSLQLVCPACEGGKKLNFRVGAAGHLAVESLKVYTIMW